MTDKKQREWDRKVKGEKYPGYSNDFLKNKPKGLSDNEALLRGATSRWKKGKYRKQAEAQEAKEHKNYRKDNPIVKAGEGPIEGTKEEYVRRNQVNNKLASRKKRVSVSGNRRSQAKMNAAKKRVKKINKH